MKLLSKHDAGKFLICSMLGVSALQAQGTSPTAAFVAVTPCRLVDTRGPVGSLGGPTMNANTSRTFPLLSGSCNIPASASAYSLNVTVVPQAALEFLTIWPTGQAEPNVSTLNSPQGAVIANAAIIQAGQNGSVDVFVAGRTDVIIDIDGFFVQDSNSTTLTTALGVGTLPSNTGTGNTALGAFSLQANAGGNYNSATGYDTLNQNTSGLDNTATGATALRSNTTGNFNSAFGSGALNANTTASSNTASGYQSLFQNTTGANNTAVGSQTLLSNISGSDNTALGAGAGYNTTGSNNIFLGTNAGMNITTTSNNILIGNPGLNSDSGTIRIGSGGIHTGIFVAGINGVTVSGSMVLIGGNGQLGTVQSSRRYKEDIRDMGDASDGLMNLRPVSFRYKQPLEDGTKPVQYGLVAEEVAQVYPELVVRNPQGDIESLQYHQLPALLLNELQKQHAALQDQLKLNTERTARIEELEQELAGLKSLLEDKARTH